ncbi:exodeoxyribonuclease VII small subunit, partial [filamentous cyanobacterium CCP5]
AVAQVEALIQQLESGDLPLEDIFSQFEQAVTTLQQCDSYLTEKRQQVELLIETLE